jgi:hypothetical protein
MSPSPFLCRGSCAGLAGATLLAITLGIAAEAPLAPSASQKPAAPSKGKKLSPLPSAGAVLKDKATPTPASRPFLSSRELIHLLNQEVALPPELSKIKFVDFLMYVEDRLQKLAKEKTVVILPNVAVFKRARDIAASQSPAPGGPVLGLPPPPPSAQQPPAGLNPNARAFKRVQENFTMGEQMALELDFFLVQGRRLLLREFLRSGLDQLPRPTTYLVRRGIIEIVPLEAAQVPSLLRRPVSAVFGREPLVDVVSELCEQTGASILLDPNLNYEQQTQRVSAVFRNNSLEAALRCLAHMTGLELVVIGDVLYLTTPAAAQALRQEERMVWEPLRQSIQPAGERDP